MCDFVSWIESDGQVLFLTGRDIFEGPKGRELRDYCKSKDDYVGHGAIRHFYGLSDNTGANKECTNFRSPDNFPPEIAKAIKNGQMRGLGTPCDLLVQAAWAEYVKVVQAAWAEYDLLVQPAWAEYVKVVQPAGAEYDKVVQAARAEYDKVVQPAGAEYDKVEQAARAEYDKVVQAAWAEYVKVVQAAGAEYDKVEQDIFWSLFVVKKNRAKAWR